MCLRLVLIGPPLPFSCPIIMDSYEEGGSSGKLGWNGPSWIRTGDQAIGYGKPKVLKSLVILSYSMNTYMYGSCVGFFGRRWKSYTLSLRIVWFFLGWNVG